MTEQEHEAYEEMTAAVRLVVDRIKEFPNLLDQLCYEVELALITVALKRSNRNCTKAARLLGIGRTALVMKRKKFKLPLRILSEAA
jgi:DNA-binding NtrC family response regulator